MLGRRIALAPRALRRFPSTHRAASTFGADPIPANLRAAAEPSKVQPDERKRKEAYLYFDSVFPIRIGLWDIRYLFAQAEKKALLDKLRTLVPQDSAYSLRVEDVNERSKDGGAFVRFSFVPPSPAYAEEGAAVEGTQEEEGRVLNVVEKEARAAIASRGYKPWFTWGESRAFLVKGKPWMEDMNRFPSSTIRVEFEGPEIPQEELYEIFRPYGKIHNIAPPSPSSKDLPRTTSITYTSIRSAAAARNCLHALVVPPTPLPSTPAGPPTLLRILFAERTSSNYIKDWATSHPRIMLPLLVALLGGLSYAVFDPVREFSVKRKVDGTWEASRWKVVSWLKRETLGRLGLSSSFGATPRTGIEKERQDAREMLEGWLRDVPDTFIVVTGPRGSGKTGLIEEVIAADAKNVLNIDCAEICKNSRTDTKLVSELASAVGYWPQFVLASSLNNMIDLASMGLIGQKAGFSSTLDVQLKQILEVTASALKDLALETSTRAAKAAKKAESLRQHAGEREKLVEQLHTEGVKDGRLDAVAGNGVISELGVGIEAPEDADQTIIIGPNSASCVKTLTAEDVVDQRTNLERLPVVVIRGFAAKGEAKQEILWEALADWAAVLVENRVAHVIFTSDSVTLAKPLAKALPNKPFNSITLNDATQEAAIQYIETKLSELDKTLSPESRPYVAQLGGRQTDLELLVQKIRAGLAPEEAVDDIVGRSATELRKSYFGDDAEEAKGLKWTREQAWALAKGLTKNEELKYADVLVNAPFKSDEGALRALENAEMISVHHRDGRPSVIRPGKPVYRSAFRRLLYDPVFSASLEFEINASQTKSVAAELDVASKALVELSQLFGGANGRWIFGGGSTVPNEIVVRVEGLLGKMREAEGKLAKLDAQKGELLKTLAEAV